MSMSSSVSQFSDGGKKCDLTYPWEEVEGDEEQMYDRAANRHAQLKAFDDIKKVVLKGYREIRETNASRQLRIEMAVANQLGDFAPYLHRHGSFKKAIEETVKPVVAPVVERQAEFRSEVEQAFGQVAADVKDGKGECMEMMRKIVEATSVRAARDERRIQTLERALRTGGLATSVGATTQATTVDANTVIVPFVI
jgi:hypothetical protein